MTYLSVRARVTAVASLVVAVVLVLAGLVTVTTVQRQLLDDIDDSTGAISDQVAADLERDPFADVIVVQGDDDTFSQLVDPSGEVVAATANMAGEPAVVAAPGLTTERDLPHDSSRFRVRARAVAGDTLVVGITLEDVDESVGALRRTLLITSPVALALLALLVGYVVGHTLRPVEEAHRRQRQFVADASHELRSPLTRIRTELEVDLTHEASADPWATHRSVLAEAVALQALIDDLLLLARRDAESGASRRVPVDLDDLVLGQVRLRADEGVAFDASGVSGGQVVGDADQLRRVVRNLLDNAGRHARTTVAIELHEEPDGVLLAVTDDGPGIAAADRDRVFERFTRLDDARSAASGGTGLGLAITRDLVEAHGGTVVVDPREGPGTRMVVRLPRA
ncbi:MAG: HAMP domain-containing histidine kinase [Actinomycetota bacterium]|nr:HAMP domain-containing histidine kinase [Acidimicrobiia bacterium]MDQ3294717.1 HAMP domain-containing histidine kinase [Actinomycetota bacterium]